VQGAASANPSLPACPQGISAVKALALAGSQGQRVYTITPQVYASNPAIVQNQLVAHSQATRERVQGYLDAGWEVSIHQAPITQDGWTGAGFTAIDPTTGAGGYLIEGASNGGTLVAQGGAALFSLVTLVRLLAFVQTFLPGILFVGATVNPFVLALVAIVTFLGVLASDNPYAQTPATGPLAVIGLVANIGALVGAAAIFLPGYGIVFAILLTFLLFYVARLITEFYFVSDLRTERSQVYA
jgi:hypothetical protein